MNGDAVDLASLAADDALIARVRAANVPEQLDTELERLLVGWRIVCRTTPSWSASPNLLARLVRRPSHRPGG